MHNYIGTYTIFYQANSDGSKSKNLDDNFLKGRYNSEIYRQDSSTLAILLPSGSSSVNTLLPKFKELNIEVWDIISGDVCEEAILAFNETDIHKVHSIMKFMIKGKNEQLKALKLKNKKSLKNVNNK